MSVAVSVCLYLGLWVCECVGVYAAACAHLQHKNDIRGVSFDTICGSLLTL